MHKFFWILPLVAVMALLAPAPAMAAEEAGGEIAATNPDSEPVSKFFVIPDGAAGIAIGVLFGLGLAVMGAARGIGNIGSSAVESIARQPEAGGRIFTSMLLSAALIEGATLFAIVVGFLAFIFLI